MDSEADEVLDVSGAEVRGSEQDGTELVEARGAERGNGARDEVFGEDRVAKPDGGAVSRENRRGAAFQAAP